MKKMLLRTVELCDAQGNRYTAECWREMREIRGTTRTAVQPFDWMEVSGIELTPAGDGVWEFDASGRRLRLLE